MPKDLLIIFVKNPELGKVKTRLAKSIGNYAALSIYKKLIYTTQEATSKLDIDRHIYFATKISNKYWKPDYKTIQQGVNLGERMLNAFKDGFSKGYDRILLIGSDLPEISEEIINTAYTKLNKKDVVFGPSKDGGYYLIGMTNLHEFIFKNKPWSTTTLLKETLAEIKQRKVGVSLIKTLNDIDIFDDLKQYPEFLKIIA